MSARINESAKTLHAEHCAKYGIEANWDKLSEYGKSNWLRKARRIVYAKQPSTPHDSRNAQGEATYAVPTHFALPWTAISEGQKIIQNKALTVDTV